MKVVINRNPNDPKFDDLIAGDVFMIHHGDDDPQYYMKMSYGTDTCNSYNLIENTLETICLDVVVKRVDAELMLLIREG